MPTKKIKMFFQHLLILFMLLGCTVVPPAQPTPTLTPTHSPEIPIVTSRPQGVDYQCIDISGTAIQQGTLKGRIVLNGNIIPIVEGKRISNPSLLVDLVSDTEIVLPTDESTNRIVVSPNGNYLAFNTSIDDDYDGSEIIFLDAKGNLVSKIETEQALPFMEWLNETTLLMDNFNDQQNPLIAITPLDGKENDIRPFVTQSERLAPFDDELIHNWGFYAYHKIIYDPTFTRAIYAALDESGPKIVFRNLTLNEDISSLESYEAWGISPKWSSDGEKIAIGINTTSTMNQYEIIVLEKNGKQLYTTHLSSPGRSIYISSLSWSPDGQSIAFWYTTDKDVNTNLRLAIFDVEKQTTTDYCIIKNAENYMWHRNDTSPIWSPDSKYLLVEITNSEDMPTAVIINPSQAEANVIKTGYEPIGWMKSP